MVLILWIRQLGRVESDVYKFVSFKFNSNIVQDEDLAFGAKRLLEVDKRLVLPVIFLLDL